MAHNYLPLLLCLAATVPCLAQGTGPSILNASIYQEPLTTGGWSTNGDRFVLHAPNNTLRLWKSLPNGTPDWEVQFGTTVPSSEQKTLHVSPSGTSTVAFIHGQNLIGSIGSDTLLLDLGVVRLDASGQPVFSNLYAFRIPQGLSDLIVTMAMDVDDQGHTFLELSCAIIGQRLSLEFDGGGSIVHTSVAGMGMYSYYPNICRADGSGGHYILTPSAGRLEHFNANSTSDLSTNYLDAVGGAFSWRDLVILQDHSPALIGRLNVGTDTWLSILRVDTSGAAEQLDLYDVGYFGNETLCATVSGQGEIAVVIGTGSNKALMLLDATGSVLGAAALTTEVGTGTSYDMEVGSIALRHDTLLVAGNMLATDQLFSTVQRSPSSWSLPALSAPCMSAPAICTRVPAPLSFVTTSTGTLIPQSPPITTTSALALQQLAPATEVTICGTTGVSSGGAGHDAFNIRNSLLAPGEPLRFATGTQSSLALISLTGSMVRSVPMVGVGDHTLTLDGLPPGMYLIRFTLPDGTVLGVSRFVLL